MEIDNSSITESISLSPQPELHNMNTMVIVTIIIVLCGIFILIILFFKCFNTKNANSREDSEKYSETAKFLIPPIFYTKNVKDPLYQEDLSEHALQRLKIGRAHV